MSRGERGGKGRGATRGAGRGSGRGSGRGPAKGKTRGKKASGGKARGGDRPPSRLQLYFSESRQMGRSLAMVVPLLLVYELTVAVLAPEIRNSAELAVARFVQQLEPELRLLLRRLGVVALVLGTLWWFRSGRERAEVAKPPLVLTEALALAVLLGPAVQAFVGHIGLSAVSVEEMPRTPTWLPFLMSVGAGLWEEIVFRLGLLGGLAVLLKRVGGMPQRSALGVAIIISSLVFALYHHTGASGEPFVLDRFAFRAVAGTILGFLFVFRGLAVVVYMHVFYDVLCDLRLMYA